MINQRVKLDNSFKSAQYEKLFVPKGCVAVFPFQIKSGFQNVTNIGYTANGVNAGDYTFFQKVFTGQQNIIALWENSSHLVKPVGKNYYNKQYQVGKTFFGKPIGNSKGCQVTSVEGNEDFLGMKISQDITLMFDLPFFPRSNNIKQININANNTYFYPKDEDLFKLYIIPQLGEDKWFIIQNCQVYMDPKTNSPIKVEVTFTSLADKLQESGRAIEQYVNLNAPGEGYAFPYVDSVWNETTSSYDIAISLDKEKLQSPGIKYLQIELQGFGVISSFYAMGRPIEEDPSKVGPPRHLLISGFKTPVINPLNRTSIPSVNFYMPNLASVDFDTQTNVKEQIKNLSQPLEPVKSDGTFLFNKNYGNTNVKVDGMYNNYQDDSWKPFLNVEVYGVQNNLSPYYNSISYVENDNMWDIINKNNFIFSTTYKLPLSYRCSCPFYLSDIPIIGGFLNSLVLGVGIPIEENIKNIHLCGFCDAEALEVMKKQYGDYISGNDVNIPLMCLGDASFNQSYGNSAQKLVGVNAVNTTLNCELSTFINLNGKVYDSVLIGQTKLEDGTNILPNGEKLLVNDTLKVSRNSLNYIIDNITFQGIFNGKIRITAYDVNNNLQWSTTLVTNSNWTGSARDWTTTFLTNFWDKDICYQQDAFIWPESLAIVKNNDIYINFNETLEIGQNLNNQYPLYPTFDNDLYKTNNACLIFKETYLEPITTFTIPLNLSLSDLVQKQISFEYYNTFLTYYEKSYITKEQTPIDLSSLPNSNYYTQQINKKVSFYCDDISKTYNILDISIGTLTTNNLYINWDNELYKYCPILYFGQKNPLPSLNDKLFRWTPSGSSPSPYSNFSIDFINRIKFVKNANDNYDMVLEIKSDLNVWINNKPVSWGSDYVICNGMSFGYNNHKEYIFKYCNVVFNINISRIWTSSI